MNLLKRLRLKRLMKKIQNVFQRREHGDRLSVAQELKIFLEVAKFYDKCRSDKRMPLAALYAVENYREAAALGSAEAQYIVGSRKLEEGKFWQSMAQSGYSKEIQRSYAKNCYEEAFNYLSEAESGHHVLAMRLHGLAYIHGWGMAADKEQGFKLIVASIDQENAWDKALEIFKGLGLNNPEFFSAMMSMRRR